MNPGVELITYRDEVQEGFEAGLDGIPFDLNPYPRRRGQNSRFEKWRRGWTSGRAERSDQGAFLMAGHVGG